MKQILLFVSLLIATYSFGSKTDSLFQRHQISFSMTNAVSHQFFDGPSGPTISHNNNYEIPGLLYGGVKFSPFYALHIRFDYSFGVTKNIRLESGLGYLMQGLHPFGGFEDDEGGGFTVNGPMFIEKITVPIHIKIIKNTKKGAIICTLGPGFTIPFEVFFVPKLTNGHDHDFYNPWSPSHANLGFDLKMGYEKRAKKNLLVDIGPIINFSDLLFFSNALNQAYRSEKYRPYQYYVGFDVALIFDIKKKK